MRTEIEYKHIQHIRSRHGKDIYYFQKGRGTPNASERVRMPDDPTSKEFVELYNELTGTETAVEGSFENFIKAYRQSPEFLQTAQATQDWYVNYLKQIEGLWGKLQVRNVKPKNILNLRNKHADRPYTANGFLKVLNILFTWGIPEEYCETNPAESVRLLKTDGDGYPPWHNEDIKHFNKNAPSQLVLAVQLALYTGQRMQDLIGIRWSDIEDDKFIKVIQQKTNKAVWIAIHPELHKTLNDLKKVSLFILNNTMDAPYTKSAFKSAMRRCLNKEEMKPLKDKGLVLHGLRKSATEKLYEAGCTNQEIAAITGMSDEMIKHYLKHFNMKILSESAVKKWDEKENEKA